MTEPTDPDREKIEEIRARAQRMADDRARILELIPQVFPEKRGGQQVRGRLNEVVAATGWTREYVARIRDGKGPKAAE
jgi:hypothetical protein